MSIQLFEEFCKIEGLDINSFKDGINLVNMDEISSTEIIVNSFSWTYSNEGFGYWSKMDDKWKYFYTKSLEGNFNIDKNGKMCEDVPKLCTCSSRDLFNFGCRCGGI